ncbi:MAG: NAD-dependent epimerase/dehydratase family protein [Clostridiales bacterium]
MKKILIIGGDSFIARNFIKRNHIFDIRCISRKNTGFVNEEIIDDIFNLEVSHFKNIDIVLNFVAIVHQPMVNDPKLYHRINSELPIYLANCAKKAGVKQFIQMSSISVYGNYQFISINSPETPITIYGQTKLLADIELTKLVTNNFIVSIIRPPMVYGESAPGNMCKLIKLIKLRIPLPFKNIFNERHFIHIDNLCLFIQLIINNRKGGIFLPSDRETISTKAIIEKVSNALNIKVIMLNAPKRMILFLKNRKPNLYFSLFESCVIENKTQNQELKYNPIKTLDDGILEMITKRK